MLSMPATLRVHAARILRWILVNRSRLALFFLLRDSEGRLTSSPSLSPRNSLQGMRGERSLLGE